jgi:hypothetical protein
MRPHRAWMILVLAIAASAKPAPAQTPPAKPAPSAKSAPAAKPASSAAPAQTPAATSAAAQAPTATPAATQTPADDVRDDSEGMKEKARELLKEGNRHYRAKKWAEAEAAYEAAFAITGKESKSVVNNLGQTKMHLKKYRDAAELLSAARRLAAKDDRQLVDIERDLTEAKKHIGTLVVTASVDGAQVLLGDKPVGTAPLPDPVFVEPGKVTLTASADGFETAKAEVDVAAGQSLDVPLALLNKPKALPPPTATATAPPPVPPSKIRNMVPGLVGGGIGVVTLIAGGALLGVAHGAAGGIQQKADAITARGGSCPADPNLADPECGELASAARNGDTMSRAGVSLLVGGLVLSAAAGTFLWWTMRRPTIGAVQLVPVASPQGGGLTASGNF